MFSEVKSSDSYQYTQNASQKKSGTLSTGAKIGVGFAIAGAIGFVAIGVIGALAHFDVLNHVGSFSANDVLKWGAIGAGALTVGGIAIAGVSQCVQKQKEKKIEKQEEEKIIEDTEDYSPDYEEDTPAWLGHQVNDLMKAQKRSYEEERLNAQLTKIDNELKKGEILGKRKDQLEYQKFNIKLTLIKNELKFVNEQLKNEDINYEDKLNFERQKQQLQLEEINLKLNYIEKQLEKENLPVEEKSKLEHEKVKLEKAKGKLTS